MAKRLLSHLINKPDALKLQAPISVVRKKMHTMVPTKEIQIPVKYGHIAAKLWGSSENRPIVAIHGWQDNAGTWDRLAPMLTEHSSILAVDLPGHGLSSWFPAGMMYNQWDMVKLILHLKDYFKWDKVSIMSHSMGALAGLRYACLFPDDVDYYISLDGLLSENCDFAEIKKMFPEWMKKGLFTQDLIDKQPPVYTLEEMTTIWHHGTKQSVALESAHYLLKRGAKQSEQDPTKYAFSRDFRLKYVLLTPELKEFAEDIMSRIKCPMLYVKALDSPYSVDEFAVELRDKILKKHEQSELHFVSGKHHVHLNNPERMAPLILEFLKKVNEKS
ncbi:putative serine hydrolase [Anticarsia gemmatalis]|uniref:putative serine hydrolase n=1 Tax=Anticarsia gemmatalis TaxID=129554 RepID=UPI003F774EBD